MSREYWKSVKNPRVVRIRRKQLDLLFTLINTDFKNDTGKIQIFKENYISFIMARRSLTTQWSKQYRSFFTDIRSHLILRIHEILDTSMMWEIDGFLRIGINLTSHVFTERFIPLGLSQRSSLQLHKQLIDLSIILLILDLDLKPDRFRQCQKCNKYFYQPTTREKNYCSLKCAANVRQARYRTRKEREKENKKWK